MCFSAFINIHKNLSTNLPLTPRLRTFAGVGLASSGRLPGEIVVEVHTLLAVNALRVVGTVALAMDLRGKTWARLIYVVENGTNKDMYRKYNIVMLLYD